MSKATRAPKGGITIQGVFYKGGQFLPSNEPQRGKYSAKKRYVKKVRKVEISPRKYVEEIEGKRSLYVKIAGIFGTIDWTDYSMIYCGNPSILAYIGMTETECKKLINDYNQGKRWIEA